MINNHRAPVLRDERTCVSPFYLRKPLLPACYSCFQAYIVYLGSRLFVRCVRVLHTRDFHLRVNEQKTCFTGCAHAERVFLLTGTAHTSIKFKSSCTVCTHLNIEIKCCFVVERKFAVSYINVFMCTWRMLYNVHNNRSPFSLGRRMHHTQPEERRTHAQLGSRPRESCKGHSYCHKLHQW